MEATIEQRLRSSAITLGGDPAIDLVGIAIDWKKNPPLIRAQVRVTDPELPTSKQVAAVQAFINQKQAPLRFRLVLPPPTIPPLPQEEAKERQGIAGKVPSMRAETMIVEQLESNRQRWPWLRCVWVSAG
ncbi:MAG: hypothetical protein MUD04_07280 [Cyanobium sp. Prado107]|nr:hypothetical protein [Cyanobium sp. Prado107]